MNRVAGRRQQAEERRAQLLAIALDVFAAKGLDGATVEDLSDAGARAPAEPRLSTRESIDAGLHSLRLRRSLRATAQARRSPLGGVDHRRSARRRDGTDSSRNNGQQCGHSHPAMLAKLAATVDCVSSGRVDLGVGAGGGDGLYRRAYDWLGIPPLSRGESVTRLREAVEVIDVLYGSIR
jgi:luciferase-like monooxygenase